MFRLCLTVTQRALKKLRDFSHTNKFGYICAMREGYGIRDGAERYYMTFQIVVGWVPIFTLRYT